MQIEMLSDSPALVGVLESYGEKERKFFSFLKSQSFTPSWAAVWRNPTIHVRYHYQQTTWHGMKTSNNHTNCSFFMGTTVLNLAARPFQSHIFLDGFVNIIKLLQFAEGMETSNRSNTNVKHHKCTYHGNMSAQIHLGKSIEPSTSSLFYSKLLASILNPTYSSKFTIAKCFFHLTAYR